MKSGGSFAEIWVLNVHRRRAVDVKIFDSLCLSCVYTPFFITRPLQGPTQPKNYICSHFIISLKICRPEQWRSSLNFPFYCWHFLSLLHRSLLTTPFDVTLVDAPAGTWLLSMKLFDILKLFDDFHVILHHDASFHSTAAWQDRAAKLILSSSVM